MDDHAPPALVTARFTLRRDGRALDFAVELPTGEITLRELLPALFSFHGQLQAALVAQEEVLGRAISCRAGCGACCRQLVPISPVEAGLLQDWIAERPPEEQQRLRSRFAEAGRSLAQAGLLERLERRAQLASAEETRQLGLDYFAARVPCPFLVEEACSVHPVRPLKCREYLVTSPAMHCAEPGPYTIAMVPFPTSFLRIILRLELALRAERPQWLPLSLLPTAPADAASAGAAEPRRPGPELFQQFVRCFAAES